LPTRDNVIHVGYVGELLVFLLIIIQFIEFAYYLPIKSSILHILKLQFSIFIILKCHLMFDHQLLLLLVEGSFWLPQILKNPSNCLLDLITVEPSANEEFKALSQDLLNLVTLCASQEQHFLDYYICANPRVSQVEIPPWGNVIAIITDSLKFNDSTHFYNLGKSQSQLAVQLSFMSNVTESKFDIFFMFFRFYSLSGLVTGMFGAPDRQFGVDGHQTRTTPQKNLVPTGRLLVRNSRGVSLRQGPHRDRLADGAQHNAPRRPDTEPSVGRDAQLQNEKLGTMLRGGRGSRVVEEFFGVVVLQRRLGARRSVAVVRRIGNVASARHKYRQRFDRTDVGNSILTELLQN
jgi:hypothetical protein